MNTANSLRIVRVVLRRSRVEAFSSHVARYVRCNTKYNVKLIIMRNTNASTRSGVCRNTGRTANGPLKLRLTCSL